MRIAMMSEWDATVMYLNAMGILNHRYDENWQPHERAIVVERDSNPKLKEDRVFVFETNGRLLRIE